MSFDRSEIAAMSVEDRIKLVQEIWDSIAAENDPGPLTEAEKRMLDRRRAELDANPGIALTWEQIKEHVRGRP